MTDRDGDWVKLDRSLIDSQAFSDPVAWQVYCWCLIKANWKTGWHAGVEVPVGSFGTGTISGAEQLGLSRSKFYRTLKKLEDYEMITRDVKRRFTLITLTKSQDKTQASGPRKVKFKSEGVEADKTSNSGDKARESETEMKLKRNSNETEMKTIEEGKEGKEERDATASSVSLNSKSKKFDPLKAEIPTNLQNAEFKSIWPEWVKHRSEIKKALTETATIFLMKKLSRWGADRSVAAITHTIDNGWVGIREPEQISGKPKSESSYKLLDAPAEGIL